MRYYIGCTALIAAGIAALAVGATAELPTPADPAPVQQQHTPRPITLDMLMSQDSAPWEDAYADGTLTPCPTEDSEQCYWDAANMGNGEGRSFLRWDGVTFYATAQ